MYKIYTSYFTNRRMKKLEDAQKIPICATIQSSEYFEELSILAPDKELIEKIRKVKTKSKGIKEYFTCRYLQKLKKLKVAGELDKIVNSLVERVKYSDVFLLCYENPYEFCHRQVLADYLNKHYQLDIQEF